MRRSVWIPVIALVLCSVILFTAYNALSGVCQQIQLEELNEKMLTILPGSVSFQEVPYTGEDANIRATYEAENGYVIHTVTSGYAGDIAMLIGVTNEGKVTGLQVRNMEETLGLGGEALTDWEFLAQFLNTTGDATVGKNIDAITGATVTSKAIARSVNSAVAFVTGADTSSGATTWGG